LRTLVPGHRYPRRSSLDHVTEKIDVADLKAKADQHKNNLVKGFTQKYNLHMLVYYEVFETIEQAIIRRNKLKI